MADLVLDSLSQLGKGLVVALRLEDGVIAEAPYPTPLMGDLSVDNAFEQMFLLDAGASSGAYILLLQQGNDCAEPGLAVVLVSQLMEQLGHVGL